MKRRDRIFNHSLQPRKEIGSQVLDFLGLMALLSKVGETFGFIVN